jgi:anti-sigma-K factor RskA
MEAASVAAFYVLEHELRARAPVDEHGFTNERHVDLAPIGADEIGHAGLSWRSAPSWRAASTRTSATVSAAALSAELTERRWITPLLVSREAGWFSSRPSQA